MMYSPFLTHMVTMLLVAAAGAQADAGPKKDAQGDPLPVGAVARLGSARLRHADTVYSVAFSNSGEWLVSGGLRGLVMRGPSLIVWNARTGRRNQAFGQNKVRAVQSVAFSPDSKRFACISDEAVWLWNVRKVELEAKIGIRKVESVAYSHDGKTLATAGTFGVDLWDTATNRRLRSFSTPDTVPVCTSVAFGPGDKWLVFSSRHGVHRAEVETGREIRLVWIRDVLAVAVSSDGKWIVAGRGSRETLLWNVETGKQRFVIDADSPDAHAVAFSPDGKLLATGGRHRRILIWDVSTGKVVKKISGHAGTIRTLAFSKDGRSLASGGEDGLVKIWEVPSFKERSPPRHAALSPLSVAFSPNGKTAATVGWDGVAHVWNAVTGERVQSAEIDRNPSLEYWRRISYAPDGRKLISVGPRRKRPSDRDRRNLFVVDTWELRDHPCVTSREAYVSSVVWAAIAPDGKTVAVQTSRTVIVYDATTLKERFRVEQRGTVAHSPDSTLLATSNREGVVTIMSVTTGKKRLQLESPPSKITRLSFSSDNKRLAIAKNTGTGMVEVWDIERRKVTLRLTADRMETPFGTAFSPDGNLLAAGGTDHLVRVWDVASGKMLAEFKGHRDDVMDVTFSPEGKRLASASLDGTRPSSPGKDRPTSGDRGASGSPPPTARVCAGGLPIGRADVDSRAEKGDAAHCLRCSSLAKRAAVPCPSIYRSWAST